MIACIYRSKQKDQMYLYVESKDDFSMIPDELMKVFGKPEFSMVVNLEKRSSLARVELSSVKKALNEQGYFLQMPPAIHDNKAN